MYCVASLLFHRFPQPNYLIVNCLWHNRMEFFNRLETVHCGEMNIWSGI